MGDRLVVGKESGAAGVDKRSRLSSWPTCFRARLLGIQPRSQAARQGPGRAGLVGSRQPLYVVTDFPFYGFLRTGPSRLLPALPPVTDPDPVLGL